MYSCSVQALFTPRISCLLSRLSACLRLYRVYSSSYLCPRGCISTLSSSLRYITERVPRSFPAWSCIISLLPPSVLHSDAYYLLLAIYVQPSSPSHPRQRRRICMWGVFSEKEEGRELRWKGWIWLDVRTRPGWFSVCGLRSCSSAQWQRLRFELCQIWYHLSPAAQFVHIESLNQFQ